MPKSLSVILFLFCSLLRAEPAYITFPSDVGWKTQKSAHFQILFPEGRERFATRAIQAAEKAHKIIDPIFPPGPEFTWIVLADFVDSLNGYAIDFPWPHMVLFVNPPDNTGQLAPLDDWLESLVLHEYTHVRHLYPANGLWKMMRTIFGAWVIPNGMLPSHLHEGFATFMETEFTKGGRGRGNTFHMYRNKAVEAGTWGKKFAPLDLLDGSESNWPHSSSAYFFGYELYRELWKRKGAKGLKDLTLSYSNNWPYFIHSPLEEVYGLDYEQLWNEVYESTRKVAATEIETIKKAGLSKLRYLTQSKFSKSDLTLAPNGELVVYRAFTPKRSGKFEVFDLKNNKVSAPLDLRASYTEGLCWGAMNQKGTLAYINPKRSLGHSDNTLYLYVVSEEETLTPLLDGKPVTGIHHLSCDPSFKKLSVFVEESGQGKLLQLELTPDLKEPKLKLLQSWVLPEGDWVSGFSLGSPSYFLLRDKTSTRVYSWNASQEPQAIWEIPGHAYQLTLRSPTSADLIAGISGRDEVWGLDFLSGKMQKRVAVSGGINSFVPLKTSYLVSSYEDGGFDLAEASPLTGEISQLSKPGNLHDPVPGKEPLGPVESYSAFSTLWPRAWVPTFLFVPSGIQFGAWIPGFDISQRHFYDIFAGYDTRGLPFAGLAYNHRFGGSYTFDVSANYLPSYLNSTGTFFKRWGATIGLSKSIEAIPMSVRVGPVFRRVESSSLGSARQNIGGEIDLNYRHSFSNKTNSFSAVDSMRLFGSHTQFFRSLGSDDNFFSSAAGLDLYWEPPLLSSTVLYLGNRVGYTEGTVFYNSYFEAGGELLFSQGRGSFLNRGYDLGYFVGRRIFNTNLEFRFPIATVERGKGLFPAFLNQIHGALVADMTTSDFGPQSSVPTSLFQRFYTSVGVEFRSDWKFFYYLPTLLRVGFYRGMSPGGNDLQFTMGIEAGL